VVAASLNNTVPVDGMEIDPFDPKLESGRLYGRGSCDTKGGMAALLDALERVLARGTLRRNRVVVGEADEGLASVGVQDVLRHLGGRRPDWVLATEPTELRVASRHKGIALAKLVARGRACHSSRPEEGRNAIVSLSRAVLALDALGRELGARRDERLGAATLSVGVIGGGLAANIVPDEAWLLLDRRLLPGEDADSFRSEIAGALEKTGLDEVEIASCKVEKPPLATDDRHPAVRRCQVQLAAQGRATEPTAVSFGTDAGLFALHDLPGVVIGPGSIAQAHTAREFVAIDQVEAMADFFVGLLESAD